MSTDELKNSPTISIQTQSYCTGFSAFVFNNYFYSAVLDYPVWISGLLLLLACFSLKIFRMRPQVRSLEHFDLDQWTLQYEDSNHIHHVQIQQMIDHRFYIAVYFL